jgi:hypothetical protein
LPYSSEQSAAEQQQFKNAENAFLATGIYPYRSNFISNKDFKSSETTCRYEMPDEKTLKMSIHMLTLPFLSVTLISLHLPHNELLILHDKQVLILASINPLPKASVESKQRRRKFKKSEILSGTPYKNSIESK